MTKAKPTPAPKPGSKTAKPKPQSKTQQALTEIKQISMVLDPETQKLKKEVQADVAQQRHEYFKRIGRLGGIAKGKKETKWQDRFVKIAYNMARIGCRDEDIADMFGVARSTFSDWKNARPALAGTLKKARAQRNRLVVGAAIDAASSGIPGHTGTLIFLLKNWMGMTDRTDVVHGGEVGIVYKSNIPQPEGGENPDEGSILKK